MKNLILCLRDRESSSLKPSLIPIGESDPVAKLMKTWNKDAINGLNANLIISDSEAPTDRARLMAMAIPKDPTIKGAWTRPKGLKTFLRSKINWRSNCLKNSVY